MSQAFRVVSATQNMFTTTVEVRANRNVTYESVSKKYGPRRFSWRNGDIFSVNLWGRWTPGETLSEHMLVSKAVKWLNHEVD